ncbi:hypothetical protein PG994_009036 [Apiospora phragmitis]|uniref:Ankyrin repeat domain-containing protein n=1 Tax=Apiospora phragmitis TaxID=2905665 RepID=A0ABR1UI55_9PEZI
MILNTANRHRLTEITTITGLDLVESSIAGPSCDIPQKLKHLLTQGLDPSNTTTSDNKYRWIIAAAGEKRFDMVTLLQEYGADLLAQAPDGMDVAKPAAFYGNLDTVWKTDVAASKSPDRYDRNFRKELLPIRQGPTV